MNIGTHLVRLRLPVGDSKVNVPRTKEEDRKGKDKGWGLYYITL